MVIHVNIQDGEVYEKKAGNTMYDLLYQLPGDGVYIMHTAAPGAA